MSAMRRIMTRGLPSAAHPRDAEATSPPEIAPGMRSARRPNGVTRGSGGGGGGGGIRTPGPGHPGQRFSRRTAALEEVKDLQVVCRVTQPAGKFSGKSTDVGRRLRGRVSVVQP